MDFNFEGLLGEIEKNVEERNNNLVEQIKKCNSCGLTEKTGKMIDKRFELEIVSELCEACSTSKKRDELEKSFIEKVPNRYRHDLEFTGSKSFLSELNGIICGAYGTGKTHMAYSIASELWMKETISSFSITREIQIINELRDSSISDHKYKNVDFLVIDEFGKVNDSEFVKAQIFNIIDHRNDWMKKTLLICNASTVDDLKKIIPAAILDRFKKCVVFMNGESRR